MQIYAVYLYCKKSEFKSILPRSTYVCVYCLVYVI